MVSVVVRVPSKSRRRWRRRRRMRGWGDIWTGPRGGNGAVDEEGGEGGRGELLVWMNE